MKMIRILFYISLFMLLSYSIVALEEGEGQDFSQINLAENPGAYNSQEAYPDILSNNGADYQKIDWNLADQSYVPKDRTGDIPIDKVDVQKIQYPSELKAEQLSYGNNLEKLKGTSKYELLNSGELNKALDKTGRVSAKADTKTNYISKTETGFEADHFESLRADQTFATNANGISLIGNTLSIKKADSVIINSKNILTDVTNFNLNPERFKIGLAETVRIRAENGYIYIENATDSTFRTNGVVEITANDNVNYNIEDLAGNIVNFKAPKNGKLTITKDETLPTYSLENSRIKTRNETLKTNTTASVSIDPYHGFIALTLGPGTYMQNDEYEFLVIEPMDGFNYSLGLRKNKNYDFSYLLNEECIHCGLIDFISEKNMLKGRIIFKKRASVDYWLNMFDNIMSKINFTGLRFMESVLIDKMQNNLNAFTLPTNYYILKEENGYGYINKYALLLDNRTGSLIETYNVIPNNTTVKIQNNVLSINNVIRVYPKNSIPLEVFLYG